MVSVALVTPWGKNVKCGIRTYSEKLVEPLAELGVDVYIIRWPRFGSLTPELVQNVVDSIPVERVDLIHVQHEYGLLKNLDEKLYSGLKALGKPVLTTMHAIGNFSFDGLIAEASDRVIVHNEFCRRRFGHPKKTVVIPHGLKPAECMPREEAKKALGIPLDAPIVGYCGFVSKMKGLETLIEAMTKIPEVGLLIGGGWHAGPDTEYMLKLKKESLERLPGRCQWLGWVPDEKLATVYGSMDLVVYPSRWITESGALLMALAHRKAVLTTHLPPTREKEKLGALMTFKSNRNLRTKIKRLLRDNELRSSLEEGACRYASDNEWGKIAERHIDLYRQLL